MPAWTWYPIGVSLYIIGFMITGVVAANVLNPHVHVNMWRGNVIAFMVTWPVSVWVLVIAAGVTSYVDLLEKIREKRKAVLRK